MKFLVMSLVRSRTAWLARFLNSDISVCYHEASIHGIGKLKKLMAIPGIVGNSDSNNIMLDIDKIFPDAKLLIIKRDPDEVLSSFFNKINWLTDEQEKLAKEITLNAYKKLKTKKGLIVNYDDIDSRLGDIWEYCTETKYDIGKDALINTNIDMLSAPYINNTLSKYEGLQSWQ